ncbi:MAG: AarF/UbiB family protein, partial [Phenylobacterium sp.]
MGAFGAFGRMTGAVWVLVRNDALLPRELDHAYPSSVATIAKTLRLFSGSGARRGRPGERLARALEGMGPVATKLGQMLSTRGDFFGREFAEDLGRLKDRLPPFPTDVARAEVERALGRTIESLYAEFGEPIGSASLAQAHEARLKDGRKVAVKVLRPGIERRVG